MNYSKGQTVLILLISVPYRTKNNGQIGDNLRLNDMKNADF